VSEGRERRSGGLAGDDDEWDKEARGESRAERLDRNWNELLQELRVVQTGVQLLTGFLLTLPFQQRFSMLTTGQRDLYLALVVVAAVATCLLIAPVALHRLLFRMHARNEQVFLAHRMAMAGSAFLGLAVTGVVTLIFDVVVNRVTAAVFGSLVFLVVVSLWLALPLRARAQMRRDS
jgi:uncharacterized protein DUF6328